MSEPPAEPRHLVAVWNPAIVDGAQDTLDAHLQILLSAARAPGADDAADDAYVWWGKIRSAYRHEPLEHLGDILALDAELRDDEDVLREDRELHLYLTDYRSLYVAHVAEVTPRDVREEEDELPHIPAMYRRPGLGFDCWFRVFDLRRLVLDDTRGVVAELRKLSNVRYHGNPVSIYGGMVDLPLIVTRPDGARWFDRAARDRLTDGRLWAELDAESAGVGSVMASLRDDVLGDATWDALDPGARLFVATAERIWREHRGDPAFDFSPVVVNLAKAYEVQLGAVLGAVWRSLPPAARLVNRDGRTVDLLAGGPPGLGAIARALGEERALRDALQHRVVGSRWLLESLPAIAESLAVARNPAAHSARVDRAGARLVRDAQLGVGQPSQLVELARVRVR